MTELEFKPGIANLSRAGMLCTCAVLSMGLEEPPDVAVPGLGLFALTFIPLLYLTLLYTKVGFTTDYRYFHKHLCQLASN